MVKTLHAESQHVEINERLYSARTRDAFLYTRILSTPFYALFLLLPFILHKDLGATLLQITAIITIKPAASILSMYWSAAIRKRRDKIVSNLTWARVLSHLPFFLFPFIDNVWFFIFSFGFYMMLHRGVIPAWMELLKLNIPAIKRERLFGVASIIGYVGDALLPFILGTFMDGYHQAWRWLFPITSLISLSALLYQWRILVPHDHTATEPQPTLSPAQQLLAPWQDAYQLIMRRPDFFRFVVGFMIGGGGIMIIQPALPYLFMDTLHLSYTELAVALTLFKSIGFVLSTPLWTNAMAKMNLFSFNSFVIGIGCCFPILLLCAQLHIGWVYTAYLFYGIMQAGSELGWNLSGPAFAKNEDSSPYSSVNVLSVGIRGIFVPSIGSLTCLWLGPEWVMVLGALACSAAALRFQAYSKQKDPLYSSS